jgi:hypothetical protein
LNDAWQSERFSIVDVALQRGDLSPILRGFVQAFKAKLARS